MNDFEMHRHKKKCQQMNYITESLKRGGYLMAEACYTLSYIAKQKASQLEANERNIDKLNNKNGRI